MKHQWKPIHNNVIRHGTKDITDEYQVCSYLSGGCGINACTKSINWQNVRDSECIGHDRATSTAAPDVVARPGDTITWHGDPVTVLSRQEFEDNRALHNNDMPKDAVAWMTSIGPTWNGLNRSALRLNGEVITHFENITSPTLQDLTVEPLVHREPDQDEDGMVTGWDGRKVWL